MVNKPFKLSICLSVVVFRVSTLKYSQQAIQVFYMSERRGVQSVNDKIRWTSHHDTCYNLMLKWRIMCIAREIYEEKLG